MTIPAVPSVGEIIAAIDHAQEDLRGIADFDYPWRLNRRLVAALVELNLAKRELQKLQQAA